MYFVCAAVIAAAGLIAFGLRSEWERRQLKTEHYLIRNTREARLKLAFISDVHNYLELDHGSRIKPLLKAIETEQPDAVIIGGDMVTVKKELHVPPDTAPAEEFLTALAARYTVVHAEGNHEVRFDERYPDIYAGYRQRLTDRGVVFLRDESISLGHVTIYGASLDMRYYRKRLPLIFPKRTVMEEKYLIGKLGLPAADRYNILLMHSPLYLENAAKWGADLVLSGHFHGGTIRLPDGRGLMTPQYHFFNRECSGELASGGTRMIVSRGLGTHTFNIRINDLPELSIIDIADA